MGASYLVDQAGGAITDANPLPVKATASTALMGKVSIDQTTPGTTNGVQLTGSITPTHTVATVGVATGVVLAANTNRKYALIINDSDTTIYLKIGADAVLNQGIRINPNGSHYEMCAANGNLATGAINGIASAASKNVIVTEGV